MNHLNLHVYFLHLIGILASTKKINRQEVKTAAFIRFLIFLFVPLAFNAFPTFCFIFEHSGNLSESMISLLSTLSAFSISSVLIWMMIERNKLIEILEQIDSLILNSKSMVVVLSSCLVFFS